MSSTRRIFRGSLVFGSLGRAMTHWAPVWVPLLLLWQVGVMGLRPTLAEYDRLEHKRSAVLERYEHTRDRFELMRDEREAWQDPVYRARLRALLEEKEQGR